MAQSHQIKNDSAKDSTGGKAALSVSALGVRSVGLFELAYNLLVR